MPATVVPGGVLTATGWATFTSRRSLEIHVSLREEKIFNGEYMSREVADGFVTYVSLSDAGKAQEIPALRVSRGGLELWDDRVTSCKRGVCLDDDTRASIHFTKR